MQRIAQDNNSGFGQFSTGNVVSGYAVTGEKSNTATLT